MNPNIGLARRFFGGITALALVLVFTSLHVSANSFDVVIDYDAPFLPEGIALDKVGNIYVSLANQAEVRQIAPDGTETVYATLPAGGFGLLGLITDAPGNVYAAVATADGFTNGVYRVDRNGASHRLPGTEAIFVPNAMVFDKQGTMYVTDSIIGAVWRIPRGGSAEQWIQDDLLVGTGVFGFGVPIGANGIVYRDRDVFVANSEKGLIVRIPVNQDGSAGTPVVMADDPDLFGVDGLALDVHGNLFAAIVAQDKLVHVNRQDGSVTVLADSGFDGPASLAFGTGKGERQTLFITNFALLTGINPGVVKVDVGVAGWPQP